MNLGAGALLLFLIPLSGYVILANLSATKAIPFRAEGQQLFYRAAAWGVAPATVAVCMMSLASAGPNHQNWIRHIEKAVPALPAEILMLGLWMLASAYVLAFLFNFALWVRSGFSANNVLQGIHREHSNDLIHLLMDAFERDQLLLVTLKSRKVYCGSLLQWPVHARREALHLSLLPMFSSWRDKDSLQMGPRTEYPVHDYHVLQKRIATLHNFARKPSNPEANSKVDEEISILRELIAKMDATLGKPIEPRHWLKVIPIEQIESISLYDPAANAAWFPTQSAPATPAPPTHLEPSA